MKKLFLAISLFLFSSAAYSQYDRYWLEVSAGLFMHGTTLKLKARESRQGWALIHSNYTEDEFLGTTNLNRETLERHDAEYKVYGVSKFISAPFNWGYAEAGAGLGYANGTWSENCEHYQDGFLGSSDVCDLKDGATIGIPIHASATVGKFIGIGVNLDVFLSFERDPVAQFGVVIPFGLFTK